MDSYQRQTVQASWQELQSDNFDISNGVRQGGVLSPILFNIYMDELIKQLEQSGDGCHIGHIFYGALGYADDLTLLSPTAKGLQRMLEVCEQFGIKYDVAFNPRKTVCICFSRKQQHDLPVLTFNNEILKWSPSVKHLGNYVQHDLMDDMNIKYKQK